MIDKLGHRLPQAWKDGLRPAREVYAKTVARAQRPQKTLRALVRPRVTVLFYPEAPSFMTFMFKLCVSRGWRITTDPGVRADAAFLWQDATFVSASLPANVTVPRRTFNTRCRDISKERVEALQKEVFGYSLAVDPLTHEGPIVEKSNYNGKHDGRILQGPLNRERVRSDHIYQRLVDTDHGGRYLDHRLPILAGEPQFVYVLRGDLAKRFGIDNELTVLTPPEEIYAPQELNSLVRFARRAGLDYGELDVLRDKDGRIYVIDINKTPYGPPGRSLAPEGRIEALRIVGDALEELILAPPTATGEGRTPVPA